MIQAVGDNCVNCWSLEEVVGFANRPVSESVGRVIQSLVVVDERSTWVDSPDAGLD